MKVFDLLVCCVEFCVIISEKLKDPEYVDPPRFNVPCDKIKPHNKNYICFKESAAIA